MAELLISSTATSDFPAVLCRVQDPECNLAIWQRNPPVDLGALINANCSDVRFTTELVTLGDRLSSELEQAGFSYQPEWGTLVSDIADLAARFCGVARFDELEVRLEVVTTNSCRKWHADFVKARLITTYVGPGTQWLNARDADRVKLGLDPKSVNTMSAGDVGVFKGKLATSFPAIHRSPPVAGTGERRLLLVLNPPEYT